MSLSIKIPAKKTTSTSPKQETETASSKRNTIKKRRIADSDDEGEDDYSQPEVHGYSTSGSLDQDAPRTKRVRTPKSALTLDEMDVDIDIDIDGEIFAAIDPDSSDHGSKKEGKEPRSRRVSIPTSKKRSAMGLDDETEYGGTRSSTGRGREVSAHDDDDYQMTEEPEQPAKRPPPPQRQRSAGGKGKTVSGKGAVSKTGKGRIPKDRGKELTMRDERKVIPATADSDARQEENDAIKRPPIKTSRENDNVTVDNAPDDAPVTSAEPPTMENANESAPVSLPPIKKRKLPTIKKNKPAGSTGTATPPTAPKTKLPTAPLDESQNTSSLPVGASSASTRQSAASIGLADFDLRKPSVYAELFKTAGGSTPRSGLNRREKEEERRKELNKMRDEARAQRTAEAKHPFDLQAQPDKIARFEERLRSQQSPVLFPNILASKFKWEWEQERSKALQEARHVNGR